MNRKTKTGLLLLAAALLLMLTACGNKNKGDGGPQTTGGTGVKYAGDIPAAELEKKVADALGENYWPDSDIPVEMLEETYGLPAGLYEEAAAKMPMISTNVDALIIVKAVEGQEEAVKEALEGYRNNAVENAMQYPMNVGKVQASAVRRFGRYVCFAQLGGGAVDNDNEEEVVRDCKAANETALTVIETALTH